MCASMGQESAGDDGLEWCETGCSLKAHAFELSKPHPGACRALCAVVVELCKEDTWTMTLPITWEAWDVIEIAGNDLRTILLTTFATMWILRATAWRKEQTGNRRQPGCAEDAGNSTLQVYGGDFGEAGYYADAAGEFDDGMFGDRDPDIREAWQHLKRQEEAILAEVESMRRETEAEWEQIHARIDAFRNAYAAW